MPGWGWPDYLQFTGNYEGVISIHGTNGEGVIWTDRIIMCVSSVAVQIGAISYI